ncbi:efflux RND transporter periplasmic adaptor subunit, partial [Thioclava sp. BHET1]
MPTPPARKPRRRSPWRWILALIMLLALLYGGWRWYSADAGGTPNVLTAVVKRGSVEETVLANGTLRPSNLVAVGAQVSGRVTAIKVKVGDKVQKGQLLAEIDSSTQQNALKTAQADLANIQAQLQEKQANLVYYKSALTREQKTLSQLASSQADYDSAVEQVAVTEAQIAALDAQITAAQVAVNTAQVNLRYTKITAPSAGTVLAVVTQQGQTVNATQTAPTMVILGQLDVMSVRAQISEVDVTQTKPGQKLYFTILGDPSKRYDGVLQSIDPAPESITSDSSITSSSSSSSSSSSATSTTAIYYYGNFSVPNPDGFLRT